MSWPCSETDWSAAANRQCRLRIAGAGYESPVQAAVAGNVHPAMTTIMTAIMTTTTPATMPVKQVEALKYGGRDSDALAIAVLKVGSRGGLDHGEQPLLAAHDQRLLQRTTSVSRLIDEAVGD